MRLQDAEDLAQDVFLGIWSGTLCVVPDATFTAAGGLLRFWTAERAVAYHRHWRAQCRDRSRQVPLGEILPKGLDDEREDASPLTPHSPAPSPERRAYASEQRARIVAVLLAFPTLTRRIAVAWFLHEDSTPEIAATFGVPRNTVNWQVGAAKRGLRRCLRSVYQPTGVRAVRGKA